MLHSDSLFVPDLIVALGNASLALPLAAGIVLVLALQQAWRQVLRWVSAFGITLAVVSFGKVGFGVFGWSLEPLHLYVISGHAMLAASVYPMLLGSLFTQASSKGRTLGIALGVTIALAMMVVLIEHRHHTISETIAGGILGFIAAGFGLVPKGCHTKSRKLSTASKAPKAHNTLRLSAVAIAASPLMTTALLGAPAAKRVHHAFIDSVAARVGVEGIYVRVIRAHPETGERVVAVKAPRSKP